MKKQFYYILVGVLALAFTACSSDDDNKKKTNSASVTKQFVAYELYEKGKLDTKVETIKYDNKGRMIEASTTEIDPDDGTEYPVVSTVTYLPNAIMVQTKEKENTNTTVYTLDEKGRIAQGQAEEKTCTYSYDKDNQLVRIKTKNDPTDIVITWKDGNVVGVAEGDEETTYTYNALSSKKFMGINSNISMPNIESVDPILFKQGSYGVYPKNLIQSFSGYTIVNENGGTKRVKYEYTNTYTFDKDNYVTKVVCSNGYLEKFTWR